MGSIVEVLLMTEEGRPLGLRIGKVELDAGGVGLIEEI
jgi:hypothetical protein